MAKIIEARAKISGEEKLSPMLDKLAKKFEQVRKSAKSSEGVDKMAAAIGRVGKQMQAVDRFNSSRSGIMGAFNAYRDAQRNVEAAARAMRAGQGDAAKLTAEYNRAVSAVQRASSAFERQRSAVLANKRALGELGVSSNRIISEQQRIAASVDRANSALDRQRTRGQRLRTAGANVVGNLSFLAGPAILRGTKAAVEGGAEIQSRIVQMRAAGIPEGDIQRELGASAGLSAKYTNVKRSDILERYKELRSVLLHPDEATHLLEPTIKANSAMNAIDRSGHMAEGLQFAIKGAEVLGLAQDPKRFTAYLDAFVKAQQVMGKTITPEQMFELAKYSKASGSTLSDRFKFTTGVSLAQEMGGSTTGVSIDQFIKQITGGFQGNLHSAAKEFVALGLADKGDFETTKTGEIKGMKAGRHVKGSALAQTDPDRYVSEYLLPALVSHGFTDQNAQIAQVRRMFPSTRAADLVSKLITQAPSFENHAKLYGQAQGMDALNNNQNDPFVALNSLTTSLGNFGATLTSPMMEQAAGTLSGMASGIASWGAALAQWQKENPTTASVAGGAAVAVAGGTGLALTYSLVHGLMSGFGLKSSAAALDGSAAALMRAAAALGGGSVPGKIGTAVTGGIGAGAVAIAAGTVATAGALLVASTEEANSGEQDIYKRNPKSGQMELTPYGRTLQGGAPVQAELHGEAKVSGEAKITIDIPGLGSRIVNVPLSGTMDANGPGSLGVSSPGTRPGGLGHR